MGSNYNHVKHSFAASVKERPAAILGTTLYERVVTDSPAPSDGCTPAGPSFHPDSTASLNASQIALVQQSFPNQKILNIGK
jgi:hypothetical protein